MALSGRPSPGVDVHIDALVLDGVAPGDPLVARAVERAIRQALAARPGAAAYAQPGAIGTAVGAAAYAQPVAIGTAVGAAAQAQPGAIGTALADEDSA